MSAYGPCHVSNGPCHVICTDCIVNKFLPVWQIRQNTISRSYSVHLNPFEVRWVRDNEAYVPVHFEAILSTLNFEQNLIPWITPPHWEALDLQKTTFSLSEDEGIVPSPFQPQSTWPFLDLCP
jgi:hypothetical protein